MSPLLPRWLEETGPGQGVDPKLDLTVRLLALASEAPPGLSLPDTTIGPPEAGVLADSVLGGSVRGDHAGGQRG